MSILYPLLFLIAEADNLLFLVDPELRAEFEEHQKKSPVNAMMSGQGGGENPLGNFDMAAFLAGSNKKDGGNAASSTKNQGVRR